MKKVLFSILILLACIGLNSSSAENWNISGIWVGEANGYPFRLVLSQNGQNFTGQYEDTRG